MAKAIGSYDHSQWGGGGDERGGSDLRGGRMEIGCNLNIVRLFILFHVFVCVVSYIDNQSFQGQTVSCNQSSFLRLGLHAYNRGCLPR